MASCRRRDYDLLLEWVSEKGSGTWGEFKNAWSWISGREEGTRADDPAGKAWVAASNLAALAHLEISWDHDGRWAVAPAVLTMLPNSGGRALLTGSRTRALYRPATGLHQQQRGLLVERIAEADLDIFIHDLPMDHGPTSVFLASSSPEDVERLADLCGIRYSYSVSAQLARLLPPLRASRSLWRRSTAPQGHSVERFDTETLTWVDATEQEATKPGLYRWRLWDRHVHILTDPLGVSYETPRSEAVYEVLRWEDKSVLRYDTRTNLLWVTTHARLPLMHERAAVLCSGRLPHFRRARCGVPGNTYVNIPPELARLIAQSLEQRLEET